ncbi:MAG TPA: DUF5709 domain-containing protein [Marmoricola sp.]
MSSQPGEADREIYGEQSVDDEDQLQQGDTLDDRGVDDVLDEGYSPPEHEPAHLRHGMTLEEQREGETLDQRLAEEEPDIDPYADETDYGTADPRAGRLVAPDEGLGEDRAKDEVADDVGIDGAGASAEEAAVHVIESEDGPLTEPAYPDTELLDQDEDPDPQDRPW